jgi:hypothetical protein
MAWMTSHSDDIAPPYETEMEFSVDSFELLTNRHLNALTGQVVSRPVLFLNVSLVSSYSWPGGDPLPPPVPEIGEAQVIFTDLLHPNVGDIDGDHIQLYVSIVETQTWWQILSNGPSTLWVGVSEELGVVDVYLEPRHPGGHDKASERRTAVRTRLRRLAEASG